MLFHASSIIRRTFRNKDVNFHGPDSMTVAPLLHETSAELVFPGCESCMGRALSFLWVAFFLVLLLRSLHLVSWQASCRGKSRDGTMRREDCICNCSAAIISHCELYQLSLGSVISLELGKIFNLQHCFVCVTSRKQCCLHTDTLWRQGKVRATRTEGDIAKRAKPNEVCCQSVLHTLLGSARSQYRPWLNVEQSKGLGYIPQTRHSRSAMGTRCVWHRSSEMRFEPSGAGSILGEYLAEHGV